MSAPPPGIKPSTSGDLSAPELHPSPKHSLSWDPSELIHWFKLRNIRNRVLTDFFSAAPPVVRVSFHRSVRSPVHAHYGLIVSGADRFHRAGLLLLIPEPALNLIIVKQTVSSQQNPELLRARW